MFQIHWMMILNVVLSSEWQVVVTSDFSIFDGDPNGQVFRDYTAAKVVPDYSHHKLTAFEFVDGVNAINIKDIPITFT